MGDDFTRHQTDWAYNGRDKGDGKGARRLARARLAEETRQAAEMGVLDAEDDEQERQDVCGDPACEVCGNPYLEDNDG